MPAEDEIARLIFAYADAVDRGDFDAVGELFADGTYRAEANGGVFERRGGPGLARMLRRMVTIYDDGTPSTKHVTTNVCVAVEDGGTTATATSYFTVLQARPELPLQVVVAGRYEDRFVNAGGRWRFTDRLIRTDLVGDVSHHLGGAPPIERARTGGGLRGRSTPATWR